MRRLELDLVRHALCTARRLGYAEVELDLGEEHFHAKLLPVAASAEEPAAIEPEALSRSQTITAPAVGYYQDGPVPLRVGAEVKQGDHVASILALGIANDVETKWTGTVSEVLVAPDQAVEFGQALARIHT